MRGAVAFLMAFVLLPCLRAQQYGTIVPNMEGLVGIDWGQYQMVQPSGPIPDEFLEAASIAYDRDKERITREDSRIARKAKKDFFLESNFVINQMLHSGKVLFGDPMSRYLSDVADQALAAEPALREGLRFYTVRSGAVNAFATDRGSIFVTLGLLARLENEAQLAFILAHEAAHVQEQHTVRLAIESAKLEKLRSVESQLLEGSRYSQGQESEADGFGFEWMLASVYPAEEALGALAILEREFRPFAEGAALDPQAYAAWALNPPEVEHDSAWLALGMDSIGPWLARLLDAYGMGGFGQDADSIRYPTHPSLNDRKDALVASLNEEGQHHGHHHQSGQQTALVDGALARGLPTNRLGAVRFEAVRRLARHELLRQYLLDGAYEQALFVAEAFLAADPDHAFAFEARARALTGLVVYNDEEAIRPLSPDPRVDATLAEFGAWSDYLYRREWLAHGWLKLRDWANERPDIDVLGSLRDTLANRLASKLYADFEDFPEAQLSDLDSAKLRRFPYRAWRDALPLVEDWQEDPQLRKELAAAHARRLAVEASVDSTPLKRKGKGERQAILVLDPGYFRVNETSRQPIDYLGAEGRDQRLDVLLGKNLSRLGYDMVLFNPMAMEADQSARFAEYIVLRSAFGEAFDHQAWLPRVDALALEALMEKYGTNQVLWPFTLGAKDHPKISPGLAITGSFIMFPLLPYFIYGATAKDKHTIQLFLMLDLEQASKLEESGHHMRFGDSRAALQSGMYHCLDQLLKP